MNLREFRHKNRSGLFYRPPLYAIQTHEESMKEGLEKKFVQVTNGFQT